MSNKEYGGYIELETYHREEYYENFIALNCGRNALAYLIENRGIKKILIPYFLCSSVSEICKKMNVQIEYYNIDINFRPIKIKECRGDEYFYIVNYYGQLKKLELIEYKKKCINLIIDNAQHFFQKPIEGIDTIYTCRKYFGVPDGAYVATTVKTNENYQQDISFERMNYLLGRYEKKANNFYEEYCANNKLFVNQEIKYMSKLTHNLLRGINYEEVAKKREKNFTYLDDCLKSTNKLQLNVPVGAFMCR